MSFFNENIVHNAKIVADLFSNNIDTIDDIMMQILEAGTKLKYLYDNQSELKCCNLDKFNKHIEVCEYDLAVDLYILKIHLTKYMGLKPKKLFGVVLGDDIFLDESESEFYNLKCILEVPKQETQQYYCVEHFFRDFDRRMKKSFVVNHIFEIKDRGNILKIMVEI